MTRCDRFARRLLLVLAFALVAVGTTGCPDDGCEVTGEEICDGVDNDCNGEVDEGLEPITCGLGECEVTIESCVDGEPRLCTPGASEDETCDGLDNDCDGSIDDGLGQILCGEDECEFAVAACVGGVAQTCEGATASTDGDGCETFECLSGQTCQGGTCTGGTPSCLGGQVCEPVNQCVSVLGGPCAVDDDCSGGASLQCEQGTCKSRRGSGCSTGADCGDQNVCDGATSTCVAPPPGGACQADADCTEGMSCSLGSCRIVTGGACEEQSDCAFDHFCDDQTLTCLERLVPLGGACDKENECQAGLVCDECTSFRIVVGGPGDPSYRFCDPAGTCKEPTGSACTSDAECRASDECRADRCRTALLDLGEVCDPDPPTGTPLNPPLLADSPNNASCESGNCFANTADGGSPLNPPDFKCCQDSEPGAFQTCSSDADCCHRFIECESPDISTCTVFPRGCLSIGICGPLGQEGAACEGDADCMRAGELVCVEGTCQVPFVPPVLEHGWACDPANPNGFCGPELECLSCNPDEDTDYRCLDRDQSHYQSCCRNGFTDDFWCGEGDNCCSYECASPSSVKNCGECGNDCTAIRDSNACYTGVACRESSYCVPFTQCEAGEVCVKGSPPDEPITLFNASWEYATCEQYTTEGSTGRARGSACDSGSDCASGVCESPCAAQPFAVFCFEPKVCG